MTEGAGKWPSTSNVDLVIQFLLESDEAHPTRMIADLPKDDEELVTIYCISFLNMTRRAIYFTLQRLEPSPLMSVN
jgi:hypothetical protein